jgi:hypothetical protein
VTEKVAIWDRWQGPTKAGWREAPADPGEDVVADVLGTVRECEPTGTGWRGILQDGRLLNVRARDPTGQEGC